MKPGVEALNAYVDGELDKDSAADVAHAIAADPAIARKVATLTDLRSTLAESVDVPDLHIDDLVPVKDAERSGRKSGHGHGKWMTIAACLAGLLIVAPFLYRNMIKHTAPDEWIASVLTAHDSWSLQDSRTEDVSFQSTDFLSGELARLVYVPDLTSARLQMIYVNPRLVAANAELFVAGFAGTRGCKITMVASGTTGLLDGSVRDFESSGLRVIAWNAGPLDYVLISQGMDNGRFELIAATVRESSLNHQPVNPETRVALGISRERSAPCAA